MSRSRVTKVQSSSSILHTEMICDIAHEFSSTTRLNDNNVLHNLYPFFFQEAVSRAIEFEISRIDRPECFFVSLARELEAKRDKLMATLTANGFNPTLPHGGYFIVADWTKLGNLYQPLIQI